MTSRERHANAAVFVPHAGCPHRCCFCDQRAVSGAKRIPSDGEVAATLERAAESLRERGQRTEKPLRAEIAFFGGSFTAIPRPEMLCLLGAARPFLGEDGFSGIRISTRPDAVDEEKLGLLREHGVSAVELGAQSMDDAVLAACGRGHTASDVERAARLVRAGGFSLGLQMMTGLPGSSAGSDRSTALALAGLGPDTVRVYPALVLEGTALAALWRAGKYAPQTLEDAVERCAELLELFDTRGVRVIRMGLHEEPSLRDSCLAGPYHPAFRELCESRVLLRRALAALEGEPPGETVLAVGRGSLSRMIGQRRANLRALAERGYRIRRVAEDDAVPYLCVHKK